LDAFVKLISFLISVDDSNIIFELEDSVALGGSRVSLECMNEKPELVLKEKEGGQVS
jgi:hypothetical protein